MALTLTKVFLLISLLACLGTALGTIEGSFTSTDGYQCEWMEQVTTTLCRNFRVKCNRKKPKANYNCVYHGNPHGCAAYNKKQRAFYTELAKQVAAASPTACSLAELQTRTGICAGTQISNFMTGPCSSLRERIVFKEMDIDEY